MHDKKPSCGHEFWALATKGTEGPLHVENALGMSELSHNLSEMCIRHCISKGQVGHMGKTFHRQNDRLIQDLEQVREIEIERTDC
jgi:hypothetical protein